MQTPPENALTHRASKVWLDDGILYCVVHVKMVHYTIEDVQADFRFYRQLAGGRKRPLFLDIRNAKSADREVRVFGASEEAAEVINAQAILIDSAVTKMIGNLFMHVNRPPFPTRLFTDPEVAVNWLRQFVD